MAKMSCFLCRKRTAKEDYCYGCKTYLCESCYLVPDIYGKHKPLDHIREPVLKMIQFLKGFIND